MKSMIQLEFSVNVAPAILFPRLSTPGGLIEWFADDIRVKEDLYTFVWNGMEQKAKLLHRKRNKYIRFKWTEDSDDQSYFEFKIARDELTNDIALIITDFAEDNEKADVEDLWRTQIDKLRNTLGVT